MKLQTGKLFTCIKPIQLIGILSTLMFLLIPMRPVDAQIATTPVIEFRFELPQVQGNQFDFTVNDVQVTFSTPSGIDVTVPAFFDGGITWAARHTPDAIGRYAVRSIMLNGSDVHPQSMNTKEFNISGSTGSGFVRIDRKDKMRFEFDDGTRFYPVGYNLAWRSEGQMPPLVDSLDRMGRAGVNWSRIWMNYWDGKNLDWPLADEPTLAPGTLSLTVAKKWDDIVAAALRNHVYFQMVLQHHGQYSTTADSNWQLNPWNKASGGWLEKPEQFFSDARAIQLTKNKFRYIVARWGYAPAIMAFELCNEVESTDGFKKDLPSVAAWHATMAKFIRQQDRYRHLITTSSDTSQPAIWPATDYYQAHAYPADIISAISGLDDQKLKKPYFYGEMGGSSSGPVVPPQEILHTILWASLMSGASGAGEYWYWYEVEPRNLLGEFTSVQKFIKQSEMLNHDELRPIQITAKTAALAPLRLGPGRDWAPSATTQFSVDPGGHVKDLGGMSAFLQGNSNHAMFPSATFEVNYPEKGTFAVAVDQATARGAKLDASLDGQLVASLVVNARTEGEEKSDQSIHLNATLELAVPPGAHTIRLENTGDDWIHLRQFVLTPYASELAVLGKTAKDMALLWIYRRTPGDHASNPITGHLTIPSLEDGTYRVVWWNTQTGSVTAEQTQVVTDGKPLTLLTQPINNDAACWIVLKK